MRKFHVDPYIHSLEHIFFIIPLISFDPGALRPDVKFTGTKVICAKHKENSTNPVSGKCCVCKSELVDGQYKYCDTCSLRYYVCILCGVGAT